MKISGLQKTTLLDYPGKVACTVFIGGCNFRCPYCHNASLVLDDKRMLLQEELMTFLDKRKGILDGVCITGGEPLIHEGIQDLVQMIKEKGFLVKLDTNGSFPEKLITLVEQGLVDYVAMDVKNSFDRYQLATGCDSLKFERIRQSIDYLLEDHVSYEFRTTLVKGLHSVEDIRAIGRMLKGAKRYFIQNYEDSGDIIATRMGKVEGYSSFSEEELFYFKEEIRENVSTVEIRGVEKK